MQLEHIALWLPAGERGELGPVFDAWCGRFKVTPWRMLRPNWIIIISSRSHFSFLDVISSHISEAFFYPCTMENISSSSELDRNCCLVMSQLRLESWPLLSPAHLSVPVEPKLSLTAHPTLIPCVLSWTSSLQTWRPDHKILSKVIKKTIIYFWNVFLAIIWFNREQ